MLCESSAIMVYVIVHCKPSIALSSHTHRGLDRFFFLPQTTAKRSHLSFDAANALAFARVSLTTSIVFVAPPILNYLLRFFTTPAMQKQDLCLQQLIVSII